MAGTPLAYKSSTDLDINLLQLYLNGVIVAFATSSKLTISTDARDTSSKMSGGWKEVLSGMKSYTVSHDGLVTRKTGAYSIDALIAAQISGAPLEFKQGAATRTGDEATGYTYAFDDTKPAYSGQVIITQVEVTSDNNEFVKCTASLQGTGALVPNAPAAALATAATGNTPSA
jgi:predicted secreted protein